MSTPVGPKVPVSGNSFKKPLKPLYTLSVNEYVKRHENGTLIEQKNEETVLQRFNDLRTAFKAWPIAPIDVLDNSFTRTWLLLVQVPSLSEELIFPSLTDNFRIDIEKRIQTPDGTYSLVNLSATRVKNPYEDAENLVPAAVAKLAAFNVQVPRSRKNDDGEQVDFDLMEHMRTASALDDFGSLALDETRQQMIIITWDTFSNTYEAELAALRRLAGDCQLESRKVGPKCKAAFEMILDFRGSDKTVINLHNIFPHLENPHHPEHNIRHKLLRRFRSFNKDHMAAFSGLRKIPNGLYFVNGCPGAGKTEWNMVISALIQSVRRPGAKKRYNPILFLVDLNKTVDDAADRYWNLTKDCGLRLRIIRMHGWPYEMKNSDKLGNNQAQDSDQQTDFTKKFLLTANIQKNLKVERNANKAPTLDEAAWDYFEMHKHGGFIALNKVLARLEAKEVMHHDEWKTLRNEVSKLYTAVLKQADFIATTPVAAYGNFSKLFKPDIIIVDEAPHARELTTLIPIAFFEPIAWIFTGDVNQTRPFVKSGDVRDALKKGLQVNPYSEQLRLSLMARANGMGAINSSLLINKRAHGNLHKLPSDLFYGGKMSSDYSLSKRFPESVSYLRRYLEAFGNGRKLDANRAIVALSTSKEETHCRSFWNPVNQRWILVEVATLLQDPFFRSITDGQQPGCVMIQTPYSVSMRQYTHAVKQWPIEWQERVEVLTVDKAQGNQADVVFLDMVRTTRPGFMDEAQRLNVAITRARQAEIVLMHPAMTFRFLRGKRVPTDYISKVWDDAVANNRLFVV
ncbi:atp-dependent helicase [Fusarium beomiforme]|uniref:Atp-dependent helicase n=1 Tax=Fusarium beomiforme TaxID=44412 RepID=A0A9P5DWH0_9HYPO|nr:atp-dependent helicase [Fusarium beomiforme]